MLKDIFLSVTQPFATSRTLSKSLLVLPYNDVTEDTHKKLKRCNSLEKSHSHYVIRAWGGRRGSAGVQRTKSHSLPLSQQHRVSPVLGKSSCNPPSPANSAPPVNILVIGSRNVGKSAILVRFITRRYIGEYMSGKRETYTYCASFSDEPLQQVVFRDESCHRNGEDYIKSQLSDDNLAWADGIIMVYDVGDKRSFDYAVRCVRLLITKQASDFEMNHNGSVDCKAVLLLGNKTDMVRRRCVDNNDVKIATKSFPSWVCNCQASAAEEYDEISKSVYKLISHIREQRLAVQSFSAKLSRTFHMANRFKHKPRPKSENIGDSHFYC